MQFGYRWTPTATKTTPATSGNKTSHQVPSRPPGSVHDGSERPIPCFQWHPQLIDRWLAFLRVPPARRHNRRSAAESSPAADWHVHTATTLLGYWRDVGHCASPHGRGLADIDRSTGVTLRRSVETLPSLFTVAFLRWSTCDDQIIFLSAVAGVIQSVGRETLSDVLVFKFASENLLGCTFLELCHRGRSKFKGSLVLLIETTLFH